MSDNCPMLEINNAFVEYRTDDGIVKALNGLDLVTEKGQTHGLVGETGAGKTTTGLSILRLVPDPPGIIVSGSIKLNGKNLMELSEKEMESVRGSLVSMIFQDPMTALNPIITVEKQIAESLRTHERISKRESIRKAREMLKLVGIPEDRGTEYPHQFSGGMKQRVVIAIALSCNPSFIIADEPTTALDVTIQAQVLEMMKNLIKEKNMSVLMITHDLGIVADICDVVSIIYAGKIVEYGTLKDIFVNTRHPYTEGLFNSLPNPNNKKAKLIPIPGLMPDPSKLPPGCAFCPRCSYAIERCKTEKPPVTYISGEHYVRCFLYDEQHTEKRINR